MAARLAKEAQQILRLGRALLGPGYRGEQAVSRRLRGTDVLLSGQRRGAFLSLISPGFASRLTDYGPLVKALESHGLVARIHHQKNGRFQGLLALLRLTYLHFLKGLDWPAAAREVRAALHGEVNRKARVQELLRASEELQRMFPEKKLILVGHSFGTDTVIGAALKRRVDGLVLISPHPPGYLLRPEQYKALQAKRILLIVGEQDWTRDGVGPVDRLRVGDVLEPNKLFAAEVLAGVGHMDFALPALGPGGWERELVRVLGRFIESAPAT